MPKSEFEKRYNIEYGNPRHVVLLQNDRTQQYEFMSHKDLLRFFENGESSEKPVAGGYYVNNCVVVRAPEHLDDDYPFYDLHIGNTAAPVCVTNAIDAAARWANDPDRRSYAD